nr:type II toxin-antitoxin system VapC family toxin [Mesorhizobium sp.]
MTYLIDTNVVSELRRPDRASQAVVAWAASVPQSDMFISSVTILELQLGALQLAHRDPAAGRLIGEWLRKVIERFRDRILAVDLAVALKCAELHVPDPKSEHDALIAATALVHNLVVVTRNTPDFARTGVRLLDPWQAREAQ